MFNNIQIGQHFNRSLTDSAIVQYNVAENKVEIINSQVPQDHVPVIRERARSCSSGPNLPVEAMLVHKTKHDTTAAYRITTNRYGITVVPWSLVTPEEIRKDATIIAFQTEDSDRVLTISKDKNIISASFQYPDDGSMLFDSFIARNEGQAVSSAIVKDTLYIFCSENEYDLILMFNDWGNKDPADLVREFTETRTFLL